MASSIEGAGSEKNAGIHETGVKRATLAIERGSFSFSFLFLFSLLTVSHIKFLACFGHSYHRTHLPSILYFETRYMYS